MSNVVITGANRGIGLALAQCFAGRGDTVIGVCRDASSELEALGVRVESGIDVADRDSLEDLAGRLGDVDIDVLVNNAGVMRATELDGIEDQLDAFRLQFEVNSLAPLRVVSALLDRLGDGARIAIITSRMGSIADNDSGGHYGYRMSKAAVNIAGASLAVDLEPRGIAVGLLHPGFVRTGMTDHNGFCDPEEAAAGLVERIDELSLDRSGSFRHANGETLPW
jgi:NAD(P)-dependent dehydrogenase (short-subunit alcohol dehydrogenase family)